MFSSVWDSLAEVTANEGPQCRTFCSIIAVYYTIQCTTMLQYNNVMLLIWTLHFIITVRSECTIIFLQVYVFFSSVTGEKKSMEMLFLNDFYPPISIEAIVGLQNYEKSCLLNSFRSNSNKVTTVTTAWVIAIHQHRTTVAGSGWFLPNLVKLQWHWFRWVSASVNLDMMTAII